MVQQDYTMLTYQQEPVIARKFTFIAQYCQSSLIYRFIDLGREGPDWHTPEASVLCSKPIIEFLAMTGSC